MLRRAEEALTELLARTVGSDLQWARSLPVPLERAGLSETSAELCGPVTRGGSALAVALRSTMLAAGTGMVAAGGITPEELDELGATYLDPSFVDCSFFLIAGHGRRPRIAG